MMILDVMMPRKNGKQVYDEIKADDPNVKALFLSGYTSDILNNKGIVQESVNILTKPVSAVELLRKIREVLDK
ncbi:MAG: response regulator [Nitrospirae bacterium]|nr:response regulator [Nitrospirota bacterium]